MNITSAFISQLSIDNYKSLKKTKIRLLDGINIIIGKNGSGKSNFLEFLYMYATRNTPYIRQVARRLNNFNITINYKEEEKVGTLTMSLRKVKVRSASDLGDSKFNLKVINTYNGKKSESILSMTPSEKGSIKEIISVRKGLEQERQIFSLLSRTYIRYQLPSTLWWLSNPTKLTIDETRDVNFDDSNYSFKLFQYLELIIETELDVGQYSEVNSNSLKKKIIHLFTKAVESKNMSEILREYSPIKAIRLNPNINIYKSSELTIVENLSIDFYIEGDWMPWSYLSDGTKRLFYILTQVSSSASRLILIDEPELGIHPHQFYKLLQFLKEASLEKQIIMSTHSPLALDILNGDELACITIAKYDHGTKFIKLTKTEMNKAKKYMQFVGDLSTFWLHSDLEK